MADEAGFFSQRDAVATYARLAGTCAALFHALGEAAPTLEPPEVSIAAAALARRLGEHASAWAALVPESVLLEGAREAVAPVPAVGADTGSLRAGLAALRADLDDFVARSSPVADEAGRRLARLVLADLDGWSTPSLG